MKFSEGARKVSEPPDIFRTAPRGYLHMGKTLPFCGIMLGGAPPFRGNHPLLVENVGVGVPYGGVPSAEWRVSLWV